jgi:hypothetical protein
MFLIEVQICQVSHSETEGSEYSIYIRDVVRELRVYVRRSTWIGGATGDRAARLALVAMEGTDRRAAARKVDRN